MSNIDSQILSDRARAELAAKISQTGEGVNTDYVSLTTGVKPDDYVADTGLQIGSYPVAEGVVQRVKWNSSTNEWDDFGPAYVTIEGSKVSSVATLKTRKGAIDGQTIELLSYYGDGNGGGGTLYWDATSTQISNDGTIFQVTGVNTGRWKRQDAGYVDVKWFGAKGDGITNDQPAIQSAFDSLDINDGGVIFFPKGDYIVNDTTLISSKSNITVTAEKGARLVVNGESVFVLRFEGPDGLDGADRPNNIIVENLTIFDPDPVGNTGGEESHGIRFAGYDNVEVRNCRLIDIGDEGIEFTRCRWARAYNNYGDGTPTIDDSQPAFIQVSNSRHVRIFYNYSKNAQKLTSYGVRTPTITGLDVGDIVFGYNISENSEDHAFRIIASNNDIKSIKLIGNRIINPKRMGVRFENFNDYKTTGAEVSSNSIIGGGQSAAESPANRGAIQTTSLVIAPKILSNIIKDWGVNSNHSGIYITSGSSIVDGNEISGTVGAGIENNGANDTKYQENDVSAATDATFGSGIWIREGSRCSVINNKVYNCAAVGIVGSSGQENNYIYGNESHNNNEGIKFRGENFIQNNDVYDNTTNGIIITSGSNPTIKSNRVSGNGTNIDFSGATGVKIGFNEGYITEGYGESTIPHNEASVIVNHGLSQTPTSITLGSKRGSSDDPEFIWVTSIGETTFTVNRTGTFAGHGFFWEAKYRQ